MITNQGVVVRTRSHGGVPQGAEDLAAAKVGSVLRHTVRPVLSARVMLTRPGGPAIPRPVVAQATVDVNGRIVRVRAAGLTVREATEQMARRLRVRLERLTHGRAVPRKAATIRRGGAPRRGSAE